MANENVERLRQQFAENPELRAYAEQQYKQQMAQQQQVLQLGDLKRQKLTGISNQQVQTQQVQQEPSRGEMFRRSLLGSLTGLSQAQHGQPLNVTGLQAQFQAQDEPDFYEKERFKQQIAGNEFDEWKAKEDYKAGLKGTDIADPTGLDAEQQLQAAALARKVGGVRGMKALLPMVYAQMKQGKTMDDIEDNLRYAGQSEKFKGVFRKTSQNLVMGASATQAQTIMDYLDDVIEGGDEEETKQAFKRVAIKQMPVDQQNQVTGTERTIGLLDEISDDLKLLEESGVDTNIFTGTMEEIAKKIGMVKNDEARRIATKIKAGVQKYRRSMSGVAFSVPESKEYQAMFPDIDKTAAFNTATMQGLRETLTGDLENFYGLAMGHKNYKEMFGGKKKSPKKDVSQMSDDELRQLAGV